jgi:hypothetical protein
VLAALARRSGDPWAVVGVVVAGLLGVGWVADPWHGGLATGVPDRLELTARQVLPAVAVAGALSGVLAPAGQRRPAVRVGGGRDGRRLARLLSGGVSCGQTGHPPCATPASTRLGVLGALVAVWVGGAALAAITGRVAARSLGGGEPDGPAPAG